jgi:hypothetical protein
MSTTSAELRARNLRTLAVLAGIFLAPLLASFWMYYATDWRPAGRVNHGELITPPQALPRVDLAVVSGGAHPELFHRHWTLVYIGRGTCDETCRQALLLMRQTRLSLNTEMTRVERVFLATADCCARSFLDEQHPGLVVVDASAPQASTLLSRFPAVQRETSLFIVDPLGNLMMSYDVRQNPKGLLQDLQKLLRLSHIG